MISLFSYLILILLIYGCYTDLRWLHVSNRISYSIGGLALLMFNPQVLELKIAFIIFLLASWYVGTKVKSMKYGSADFKVMAPLILMFAPIPLLVFISVLCIIGIGIGILKKDIPGFVPITIAFIIATFIIN